MTQQQISERKKRKRKKPPRGGVPPTDWSFLPSRLCLSAPGREGVQCREPWLASPAANSITPASAHLGPCHRRSQVGRLPVSGYSLWNTGASEVESFPPRLGGSGLSAEAGTWLCLLRGGSLVTTGHDGKGLMGERARRQRENGGSSTISGQSWTLLLEL